MRGPVPPMPETTIISALSTRTARPTTTTRTIQGRWPPDFIEWVESGRQELSLIHIYHAKAYSPAIGDVVATSDQEAGTVDIVFIMADGAKPGPEMINGLKGYLQDKTIRPMTDLVNVSAPEEVPYTIGLTYYINRSDSATAVTIQAAVAQAVADYQTWQRAIGRDINPSKLVAMVMDCLLYTSRCV